MGYERGGKQKELYKEEEVKGGTGVEVWEYWVFCA